MIRKTLLALSLVLLVATPVLWWRSRVSGDAVIYKHSNGVAALLHADGAVTVGFAVCRRPPLARGANYSILMMVLPGPVIKPSSEGLTWTRQKTLLNIVPSLPYLNRMNNALSLGHIPDGVSDSFRWDFKYTSWPLPPITTWIAVKLAVPYWFIAVGLVLAIYVQTYGWLHPARRRRKRGLCVKCAYDLTGNESGVCPECGHAI